MGEKAEEILERFQLAEKEVKSYSVVLERFDSHFIPRRNIIYERSCFLRRRQQTGENVAAFVTALHSLAKSCEWGTLSEEMILMVLIIGMRDQKLSDQLQLNLKLTLESAITTIGQAEEIARQRADLHGNGLATVEEVCHLNDKRDSRGNSSRSFGNQNQTFVEKKCWFCGNLFHDRSKCPARNSKCNNCGVQGHYSKVCRRGKQNQESGGRRRINEVAEDEDSESANCVFIGAVETSVNNRDAPWVIQVKVGCCDVNFKVDTGADVTVLPAGSAAIRGKKLRKPLKKLCGPDKQPLKVIGVCDLLLCYKGRQSNETIYIVQDLATPLLGRPAIHNLNLINLNGTLGTIAKETPTSWKKEFPKLFTGLGTIPGEYKICLKPDATPRAISTPRSVALPLLQAVEEELNKMVKSGVITAVEDASDWCAPMVVVPKPSGKIRICVDLTHLNRGVKREFHPIPKIEHTLGQLAGAKVFSKLDANSGFWQVPLSVESRPLTTFLTPFGRFQFQRSSPTIISADASSYGLGSVLIQEQDDNSKRPVAYASRSLSRAERRYANIEREALALTWACEKFKDFITGMKISIETDHKPLVPIFTTKDFDDLTPRLQRFRIRMMRYSFEIFYIPGKQLVAADALSRKPLHYDEKDELEEETTAYVRFVTENIPLTDVYLKKVLREQRIDPVCMALREYIESGWPNKNQLIPELKTYWSVQDELSVQDHLLLRGCRLVIPTTLQKEVLLRIHDGHLGITKCRLRARQAVWWPGMSSQIEHLIRSCPECVQERHNRHKPMMPSEFPQRPWQILAMDLFKLEEKWFIVITDYFSRYFELAELGGLKQANIIQACKVAFSRHGIPETVRSDNGPQFQLLKTSEFQQFAKTYGFVLVTSSPRYAQSNGFVEAAVKIAKMHLKKSPEDPYKAILSYRTTPLANGFSPAELLMNRKLRSTLPMTTKLLEEIPDFSRLRKTEEKLKENQKLQYDRRHGTHDLAPLQAGDPVWIIDLRIHGTVVQKADEPRSYIIRTVRGTFRRNRWHLVPAPYFKDAEEEEIREEIYKPTERQLSPSKIGSPLQTSNTPASPIQEIPKSPLPSVSQSPSNTGIQTRSGRTIHPPKKLNL